VENTHHEGILRLTIAPAQNIPKSLQKKAEEYMHSLINEMDHVGVMTLELFDSSDELIVNEIAPRVHNSGHWTIEGAQTSQFENHIRAITNSPLGVTSIKSSFNAMIILLVCTDKLVRYLKPKMRIYIFMIKRSAREEN